MIDPMFITVQARAPMFHGMCVDRSFFTLTRQRGRPAVLILVGAKAGADAARIADEFAPFLDAFAAHCTDIYFLVNDRPALVLGGLAAGPIKAIDCGGYVSQCGVGPGDTLVLVLDRHLRVVLRLSGAKTAERARACLDAVAAAGHERDARPLAPPPDPRPLGDRVPECAGMASDGHFFTFDAQYGRPAVMLLIGADAVAAPILAEFAPRLDAFAARGADVWVVASAVPQNCPVRVIDSSTFLAECGVGAGDALVLLLDRALRIALRVDPGENSVAEACLACLDALPREAPRAVSMPAPAIVLPNLLPPDYCRYLIDVFERGPAAEGTVACLDANGRARNLVDHTRKHRRDMMIESGTQLHGGLQALLLDRCRKPIARAFQADIAYTDRLLLARYDDTGGGFRRHRDNEAESVAFRQFALSVNLNTGDYDGGDLLFPEYNDHRHAPPAGGGIIFSTEVLHEAAPVTRGSRYVLLTFFHGEAAEARRRGLGQRARVPAPALG